MRTTPPQAARLAVTIGLRMYTVRRHRRSKTADTSLSLAHYNNNRLKEITSDKDLTPTTGLYLAQLLCLTRDLLV